MNRIVKAIIINAPVHAAFKTISEPANLRNLCANLMAVEDIQRLPGGGKNFKWEYKLADVHFYGSSISTAFDHDQRLTSVIQGGITGTIMWSLEAVDETTHVTFSIDYEVPAHFEQKHGLHAITLMNEAAVTALLENLKTTVEKSIGHIDQVTTI